jgi:hypothetical protein
MVGTASGALAQSLQPGAVRRRQAFLDALEPPLDALPARRDQVDEHCEIVEAGVSLGLELTRETLEPPDRQARQPAHLRQLPPDGGGLRLNSFANRAPDLLRKRSLQLRREHRQLFDARTRAVECRRDLAVAIRALFDGVEPRLGPLDRRLPHGSER